MADKTNRLDCQKSTGSGTNEKRSEEELDQPMPPSRLPSLLSLDGGWMRECKKGRKKRQETMERLFVSDQ